MSMAWEVTREDVHRELVHHGGDVTRLEAAFTEICEQDDRITDAVLSYTDFDDQVEAAGNEIADILTEAGYIK